MPGVAELVGGRPRPANEEGRLAMEEAETLRELRRGSGCAGCTSFTSISSRMCRPALSGHVPIGTSPVMTATSPSRSMPPSSDSSAMSSRAEARVGSALVHQRVGPELPGHLRAARLADEFDVIDVGRAVGPLVGARQRRHRCVRGSRRSASEMPAPRSAPAEIARSAGTTQSQSSCAACMVRRDFGDGDAAREIARHDDQLPVARAVLERGELHSVILPRYSPSRRPIDPYVPAPRLVSSLCPSGFRAEPAVRGRCDKRRAGARP